MTEAMKMVAKEAAASERPTTYVAHEAMAGRISFSQMAETYAAVDAILRGKA